MAANNFFLNVSFSVIIGIFNKFKQVLAVGILSSLPDECIQNAGYNSYKKRVIRKTKVKFAEYV